MIWVPFNVGRTAENCQDISQCHPGRSSPSGGATVSGACSIDHFGVPSPFPSLSFPPLRSRGLRSRPPETQLEGLGERCKQQFWCILRTYKALLMTSKMCIFLCTWFVFPCSSLPQQSSQNFYRTFFQRPLSASTWGHMPPSPLPATTEFTTYFNAIGCCTQLDLCCFVQLSTVSFCSVQICGVPLVHWIIIVTSLIGGYFVHPVGGTSSSRHCPACLPLHLVLCLRMSPISQRKKIEVPHMVWYVANSTEAYTGWPS